MNPSSIKQEIVDAQDLAAALIAALKLPEGDPSLNSESWVKLAYEAVLDGQSCKVLKEVPAFDKVVGRPEDQDAPLVLRPTAGGALLYLRHMFELEGGLAKAIMDLAVEREKSKRWDTALAKSIAAKDGLNKEQGDALFRLAQFKFIILTGGPGTGKTHTLKSLLRYAVNGGNVAPSQIRLVAPTGRAARRIADGIDTMRLEPEFKELAKPQTIHSLLYEPESFDDLELLVVDESSMVDLILFNQLIDKLPKTCSVVLVGDPNQLPSVEVGSVLADLCEAPGLAANKVQLSQQHRSKQEIMELAESVLSGKGGEVIKLEAPTPEAVVECALPAFIALRDKARAGDVEGALDMVDSVRVLCSHVNGPLGAETLSRAIADKLGIRFSPPGSGSLLMVTRNDRRGTGLSNGDVGVMVREKVYFRGQPAGFDVSLLPEYTLAFATTIHKAQGSEYKHAIVVLGSSQRKDFLNRQLIYTGITRAREQLTLFADRKVFLDASRKEVPRASGLKDRIG